MLPIRQSKILKKVTKKSQTAATFLIVTAVKSGMSELKRCS